MNSVVDGTLVLRYIPSYDNLPFLKRRDRGFESGVVGESWC